MSSFVGDFDISQIDVQRQLLELERFEMEDSLFTFFERAWPHMDPAPLSVNWHLQAIAEHLQAVVDGDIRRLCINVPPRSSKPVSVKALVPTRRGLIPLSEVIVGDKVLTHRGRFRRVTEVHRQGVLPTLRLTTRTGRSVDAAADHPFLTPSGWVEIGKIDADDVVGVVPQYEPSGADTISIEAARLLGYLVGDGHLRGTPNITVADDIEAEDIRKVITACGFSYNDQAYKMAGNGYWLRRIAIKAPEEHVHHRRNGYRGPVRQFVEKHGIWGGSSYTKMVPDAVMRGSDEIVENFVGAYWACDGHITTRGAKRDGVARDDMMIACDSVNREFLEQMQTLLLRLGISSLLRKKIARIKTKRQGDEYVSYSLSISTQDDAWRFASRIPIHHSKNARLDNARKRRFDFDRTVRGESVVSVEPAGEQECRCLTVEGDSSFVANGFAVHNTSMCSLALPAWTWAQREPGPNRGPGVKFMYASYGTELSIEHSIACRRLIKSEWYEKYWGERFTLNADQDNKTMFSNSAGGYRLITSVGARVTGRGGDIIVIDDPNATNDAHSESALNEVTNWWDGTIRSRLNQANTGAFIVIQQRVAENDLTGHILEKYDGDGWQHLMIPMLYEPERSYHTSIGWKDPRTEPGELLWPERFGPEFIEAERKQKWVFAGQYQQRPEPQGGGIIRRDWWQLWEGKSFPPMDYIVAALDTAYTSKTENDPSAMTVWGVFTTDERATTGRIIDADGRPVYFDRAYNETAPKVMLMYAWAEHLEFHDLIKKVEDTCRRCKVDKLLIENKAAGISLAQELRRLFGGADFGIQLMDPGSLDKLARLFSVQHIFEEGVIHAPDKQWAEMVITQVGQFPRGKHDDLVDTTSAAIRHLRDAGMLTRSVERMEEIERAFVYPGGQNVPLYPA